MSDVFAFATGSPPGRPGPGDDLAERAAAAVRARTRVAPEVAVVLGSGLGEAVADDLDVEVEIPFADLPGFHRSFVPGHAKTLQLGAYAGVPAAVFNGRVHVYEGHGIAACTMVTRLAAALGARVLAVTNAAGGLDPSNPAPRVVLIEDHLNLMGVSPLAGWRFPDGGPAFVPIHEVWDRRLLVAAEEAARAAGIGVSRGVYAALTGPSFETPAEVRALRALGADVVGMSTVPEAVAAAALGLRVLGISCVTNAAGTSATGEDVLEAMRRLAPGAAAILRGTLAGAAAEG